MLGEARLKVSDKANFNIMKQWTVRKNIVLGLILLAVIPSLLFLLLGRSLAVTIVAVIIQWVGLGLLVWMLFRSNKEYAQAKDKMGLRSGKTLVYWGIGLLVVFAIPGWFSTIIVQQVYFSGATMAWTIIAIALMVGGFARRKHDKEQK